MLKEEILIVGAGPVGLSAALFLENIGIKTRIIEKNTVRHSFSKALALNARTLEIFETINTNEMFLKNGKQAHGVTMNYEDKKLLLNQLSSVNEPTKYPYMLIISQAESEKLFEEILNSKGIFIERGVELNDIKVTDTKVEVELKHENGHIEKSDYSKILATDGAHSVIRKKLGIGFIGDKTDITLKFIDLHIETNLNPNEFHVYISKDYVNFMLPIRDNLWRIGGINYDLFIQSNPHLFKVIDKVWESDLTTHNRVIETYDYKGRVFFAGDSAHVHSPLGGRGMNLGIEDAFVFTQLLKQDRLNEYNQKRLSVVKPLVKRIETLTKLLLGKSTFHRLFRRNIGIFLPHVFPVIRSNMNKFFLGLDHKYKI